MIRVGGSADRPCERFHPLGGTGCSTKVSWFVVISLNPAAVPLPATMFRMPVAAFYPASRSMWKPAILEGWGGTPRGSRRRNSFIIQRN